jgi:dihydrofolate reductase
MDAILTFDIKKGITKNGLIPCKIKENIQKFYNKTKCNVVIMSKNNYSSNDNDIIPLKYRLNIVLTREPNKYKKTIETYKNIFFIDNENIDENIILIPNKYTDTYIVLNNFLKKFIISENELCKNYIPLCKILWVTKYKEYCSCDLFFDYELENKFYEEKVFDNTLCTIYKYTKL